MRTLSELATRPASQIEARPVVAYDETYYERGVEAGVSGYSNYRWLPELTIPMAMTIIDTLGIRRGQSVLDFGCAKGFVVKAMCMLGRDAEGVDISPYAIEHADAAVVDRVHLIDELRRWPGRPRFDFGLAKDVLEHVPHGAIDGVVESLSARCGTLLVVVPIGDGQRYTIEAYERDATHVIRQPAAWWADALSRHFASVSWRWHVPGIKDNWQRVHPRGNAVLVARGGRSVDPAGHAEAPSAC
ncbi:MAG: methyltransferase domain-containing protein [Planctomycetota bacterium]